jgi:uncharacterized membrane protein YphA (DoxX/SURF4 family)
MTHVATTARPVPDALNRMHHTVRQNPWLVRFTAATRILIAVGFIPSGMRKVLGERFTFLGTETSVGFFFEAFYRNHLWYQAVGWAQVLAAILLLIPRTAHIGAFVFFPIILNIWLITVGTHFQGTWVITSLMLLANLWLLLWEWERIAALLALEPRGHRGESYLGWSIIGMLSGVSAYTLAYTFNIATSRTWIGSIGFVLGAGLGLAGGALVAWHIRGMR